MKRTQYPAKIDPNNPRALAAASAAMRRAMVDSPNYRVTITNGRTKERVTVSVRAETEGQAKTRAMSVSELHVHGDLIAFDVQVIA